MYLQQRAITTIPSHESAGTYLRHPGAHDTDTGPTSDPITGTHELTLALHRNWQDLPQELIRRLQEEAGAVPPFTWRLFML